MMLVDWLQVGLLAFCAIGIASLNGWIRFGGRSEPSGSESLAQGIMELGKEWFAQQRKPSGPVAKEQPVDESGRSS